MNLQQQFNRQLTNRLFQKEGRYLLAVSGGLDSMVLLELMHQAGCQFEVAHANFQLRGADSDADEKLVREVCKQKGIICHIRRFDTEAFMRENKLGIQEAARKLRYDWMHELLQRQGLAAIMTAHHLDDNIETVMMNFFKGTGLTGLAGMKEKDGGPNGNIIRPLLSSGKKDMEQWAAAIGLQWREDASNESSKYTRNFFRNEVIPLVMKKMPEVKANLADNIIRFGEMRDWIEEAVGQKLKKLVVQKGAEQQIPVLLLKKTKGMATALYYWLQPAGFHAAQTAEAVKLLEADTGSYIESATHRLIKNRQWLLLVPKPATDAGFVLVEEGQVSVPFAQGLLSIATGEGNPDPGTDAGVAFMDAASIVYPIILRKWKTGDYFYPLGMSKKKKLSRFLIDSKLSIADKDKVWVLESDKKILWVVGRRIDNRFKITTNTKRWISINFSSPE